LFKFSQFGVAATQESAISELTLSAIQTEKLPNLIRWLASVVLMLSQRVWQTSSLRS